MADDQSRPSENEHQDAEGEASEARRAPPASESNGEGDSASEGDDEVENASDLGREDDRGPEDAPTTANADPEPATADAQLESDADANPEAGTDARPGTGVDARSETDAEASVSGDETAGTDETADADETTRTDDPDAEDAPAGDSGADAPESRQPDSDGDDDAESDDSEAQQSVPADVRKYERFKKMDGAQYDRVNEFLRERTYITAREWAIARLCADFRTETGVEMTKIGENLPELVPFMTDTYTPQAVNQARSSFEGKVRQAGATFLYGAMSGFFTAEELDDMMYEVTEVAKFLLEVEGVDLSVDEELEAEDRISGVMREVQAASEQLRHDEMECPNCGHEMEAADSDD